jgi:hypothetical protein
MTSWFRSKEDDDELERLRAKVLECALAPYYAMPNTPEAVALVLADRYRAIRWVGYGNVVGTITPMELALAKYVIDKCPVPKT